MKLPPRSLLLFVSIRRQELELFRGDRRVRKYRVSTSRFGVGQIANSNRTPTGWHRVVRWIGAGRPLGSVFVGRRFTGVVLPPSAWRDTGPSDKISTRILRLRGLEPGHNAGPGRDSYARYIYIHGTSHEQELGRPASHGCVRMGNRDVLDLFRRTRGHPTFCLICAE